jgi:DNA replication protein DnaC
MPDDKKIDTVCVKLTEFGASLGRVQVHEGMFSFDFMPGDIQQVEKFFAWEKILKVQEQGGKALFEIAAEQPSKGKDLVCPICGGSGWKSVDALGKSKRVSRCECRNNAHAERLLRAAHIPARYEHCTLGDFSIDFPSAHPSLGEALLAAAQFVREYGKEKKGLLLIGPIGVGKTHLAVGIIKELIRKQVPCIFQDYRELLKQIQNSYNPQVQTTELEVLKPVFEAEVLVMDEIGAIRPSEWVWDTVSHIINYRYNEQKVTIFTTNFSNRPSKQEEERLEKEKPPEQQRRRVIHKSKEDTEAAESAVRQDTLGDRITDAMRSRLHEMCRVIKVGGVDFRLRVQSS